MCNVDQVDWKPTDAISRPFGVLMIRSGATGTRNKRDWMEGIISTGGRGFVLLAANATLSLSCFFCCILVISIRLPCPASDRGTKKNPITHCISLLFCWDNFHFRLCCWCAQVNIEHEVNLPRNHLNALQSTDHDSSYQVSHTKPEHRLRTLLENFTVNLDTYALAGFAEDACQTNSSSSRTQWKEMFFRRPSVIHQRSEFLPLAAARRWSSAAVWQLLMKLNGRTHTFYLLRKSCSAFAGCRVVCGEERINHSSSIVVVALESAKKTQLRRGEVKWVGSKKTKGSRSPLAFFRSSATAHTNRQKRAARTRFVDDGEQQQKKTKLKAENNKISRMHATNSFSCYNHNSWLPSLCCLSLSRLVDALLAGAHKRKKKLVRAAAKNRRRWKRGEKEIINSKKQQQQQQKKCRKK